MKQAEVVTGYRGPKGEVSEKPKGSQALPGIPEGKRVFQAVAGRYRLQLTAPNTVRLSDGRIIDAEKPICAQFVDHMLYLDMKKDSKMIELIEAHKDYKKDFWDLKDKIEAAEFAKLQTAIEFVMGADDRQREALRQALAMTGAEDFNLPSKK